MAATIYVELPPSEERTEFSGCSKEDAEYARTFWQSVHLNPTIESRLVSSDIRQRLKTAPKKSHEPQTFTSVIEENPKMKGYIEKVHHEEKKDNHDVIMNRLGRKEEDLNRLKKRRMERFLKEKMAQKEPVQRPALIGRPAEQEYSDVIDPAEERAHEYMSAMMDIDTFCASEEEDDSD